MDEEDLRLTLIVVEPYCVADLFENYEDNICQDLHDEIMIITCLVIIQMTILN